MGTIRRLDQVKALAEPLRLQILETLGGEERTVMQVAGTLRRKPTALYHHMRVLEAAGLVRQTRTRQKRGTVERYYRAVHPEIRIDPMVFAGRRSVGVRRNVLSGVLEAAETDIGRLGRTAEPMLALRLDIDVDAARLPDLESVVRAWAAEHAGEARSAYRVTLVAHRRSDRPAEAARATARRRRADS